MKVTEKIFNHWKGIPNYSDMIDFTGSHLKISKRTYQKIKSSDSYEAYKKKYCNKKTYVNPIQKTYVNLIKKLENITKEVDKTIIADHEILQKYLDNFQEDILKTRSSVSKLIILDISITTIGIAFLIALIAW